MEQETRMAPRTIHEQGWLPMDQIFLPNYASLWSSGDAARTLEADYGGVSEAAGLQPPWSVTRRTGIAIVI